MGTVQFELSDEVEQRLREAGRDPAEIAREQVLIEARRLRPGDVFEDWQRHSRRPQGLVTERLRKLRRGEQFRERDQARVEEELE